MNREEYSKNINWNGTATREIQINDLPEYEVGEKINPGLCWTDGGEFTVETSGEFSVIFQIIENVDGHEVNYENEQECEDLGCEDCSREKEILINKEFEIVDFDAYDEEVKFAKVYLREVK